MVYNAFTKWRYVIGLIILAIGGIAVNFVLLIQDSFRQTYTIDPTVAGQLGDFVGGYVGTYIMLVSIVLLWWSIGEQMENAVRQQQTWHDEQFEQRFLELLKIHRENVAEIGIRNEAGRRTFVRLVREFRETLRMLNIFLAREGLESYTLAKRFSIASCVFMYGAGPNSDRILASHLQSKLSLEKELAKSIITYFNGPGVKEDSIVKERVTYGAFEGHLSRLSHYFRHVYHTYKFVESRGDGVSRMGNTYQGLIRAQLSPHEQALLLINCFSPMGKAWGIYDKDMKGLIQTQKCVRNIPLDFFDRDKEIDISMFFRMTILNGVMAITLIRTNTQA